MPIEGVPERGTDGPRVVLVGVDGSATSLRAAAYAAGLARRQHSRLVVVHVRSASTPLGGLVPGSAAVAAGAAGEIADEVQELVTRGAAHIGIPVEHVVAAGDPAVEITRVADRMLAGHRGAPTARRNDMVCISSSTIGHPHAPAAPPSRTPVVRPLISCNASPRPWAPSSTSTR